MSWRLIVDIVDVIDWIVAGIGLLTLSGFWVYVKIVTYTDKKKRDKKED